MMRVARAGVGVDCGGGNATEREPWTQQQHILTQETEEAVLSSSSLLTHCPLDALVFFHGRSPRASSSAVTTAEARMMTCQRSGNVKKRGNRRARGNMKERDGRIVGGQRI